MAASGVGFLIFIDDVAHDCSSLMNPEVYKSILPANVWRNASILIRRSLIMQQDKGPKHAVNTKDFIRKELKVLDWPSQSPDNNPIEHEEEIATK